MKQINNRCKIERTGFKITYRSGETDLFDTIDEAIECVSAWINSPTSRYHNDTNALIILQLELDDLIYYKYVMGLTQNETF